MLPKPVPSGYGPVAKLCPPVDLRAIANWSNEQGRALLLMALIGGMEPASGSTASSVEQHLGFWIDEAAKAVVLADGMPLTIHWFDDHWISAARGDTS